VHLLDHPVGLALRADCVRPVRWAERYQPLAPASDVAGDPGK
jgi:hypothetical protein